MCTQCRQVMRQSFQTRFAPCSYKRYVSPWGPVAGHQQRRSQHTAAQTTDIRALLEKPSWSARSLLPPLASTSVSTSSETAEGEEITPQTLAHLLRLSALPPPSHPAEEASLLLTLRNQLHFVRSIQSVDTTGVSPLRAIRDETAAGLREQTIGLATLKEVLDQEDVVGHSQRPRRRREDLQGGGENEAEDWDVLAGAGETAGRYFVVRSGNSPDAAPASKTAGV